MNHHHPERSEEVRRADEGVEFGERVKYTVFACLLVGLILFGDAIVDWADPGRTDRHREYAAERMKLPPYSYEHDWAKHPATPGRSDVWKKIDTTND